MSPWPQALGICGGSGRPDISDALDVKAPGGGGKGLHSPTSAQREHFLYHVLGCFAVFSGKHGSG